MLKTDLNQTEFVDFYLPFNGHLSASNRWVKLAELMPWDEAERCYSESFAGTGMGAPAKSARLAYGALLIKERLGITDEETVEQICENPYLQYFLGFKGRNKRTPIHSGSQIQFAYPPMANDDFNETCPIHPSTVPSARHNTESPSLKA